RRGDRLLLCSDGLSGMVNEQAIEEVLVSTGDPEACAARLIEMANAAGGHDNITVLLADFEGEALSAPSVTIAPAYQQYPLPESPEKRASSAKLGAAQGKSREGRPGSKRYWLLGVAIGFMLLMGALAYPP